MKKFVIGALLIVVTMLAYSCRQAKETHHAQSPLEFMKELGSEENVNFTEFNGIASLFVGQEAMVDSILSSPELIDSISANLGAEFGFEPTEEDKEGIKDFSKLIVTFIMKTDHLTTLSVDSCSDEVKRRFNEADIDLSGYNKMGLTYYKEEGKFITEIFAFDTIINRSMTLITGRFNMDDLKSFDVKSIESMFSRSKNISLPLSDIRE
ncbi:MAG: hypothetical protein K6A96_09620 [Prevotella sp.]|nr:hypothetical protein [Prevotella sp.]